MRRVRALFEPYAEKIKILIILRQQYDLIKSGFGTYLSSVRDGFRGSYDTYFSKELRCKYLRYDLKLNAWAHIFEPEHLMVSLYRKDLWPHNDLIHEVCRQIGIALDETFHFPEPANRALDYRVEQFLSDVNKVYGARRSREDAQGRLFLTSALAREDYTGLIVPPDAGVRKRTEAIFQKGNERVRKRWFASLTTLFADSRLEAEVRGHDPGDGIVDRLMVDAIERSVKRRNQLRERLHRRRNQ